MKSIFLSTLAVILGLVMVSCESTSSLRAGGGAFDDSEHGRKLDANSHLPDPDIPGERNFEEWRNNE
ncbi:hypothetical protein N9A86_02750 [Akkermansiaceae bacterium]|nr:hypothetical protein [Akkermansiaceae bacterium]MDB4537579.1 hypothetical protein [Akkermansiaceae bacterium]